MILPSIALAMIAAGMSGRHKQLALWAVGTTTACFFLGLVITVVTERALW